MRLVNKSSRPTEEVRRLVGIGMAGLDTKGLRVVVKNSSEHPKGKAWWGCEWWSGRDWRKEDRVVIWLPPDSTFPKRGYRRHKSSPLNHDWKDWHEALVALAAHEGKHIDRHRAGIHGNGKRGEMACEAHERWVLDRFRATPSRSGAQAP